VTYNFDPDRWYENQRRALDGRRDRGEIDAVAYDAEIDRLEARYDEMSRRLDASFDLPDVASRSAAARTDGKPPSD
jgi:hypothetical protein